ncbi:MAG TPA: hypothetical protein VFO05_16415 [Candidatus Limnocylindrales bacterium]|nr:hypothetical protein [Candidatus Limnocylindrales bacterium]
MSDVVLERIAAWEAAGLIDAATAERLRAAEVAGATHEDRDSSISPAGLASSFFGPAVSVVEMFSYLGGGFVLAAWAFLITRLANETSEPTRAWLLVAGMAVPAAVFFVGGLLLHGRSERLDRAAGVSYLLSVAFVWGGVILNVEIFTDGAVPQVAGAAAAVVAAAAYRWLHPAVLTEIGLLAAITGLVLAVLQLIREQLFPSNDFIEPFARQPGIPGAIIEAVVWIACAIVIGLIGLRESRGGSNASERRATLARFWAGVVAVVGVATAVMRTEFDGAGESHRVLEPIVGELIVLGVSAVLIERAFRRESGAYVLAAALGVIIALTDFNFSYFAERAGTEVALLVEGLLLIAIAFVAERLTRRVGRSSPPGPETPAPGFEPPPVADAGSSADTA